MLRFILRAVLFIGGGVGLLYLLIVVASIFGFSLMSVIKPGWNGPPKETTRLAPEAEMAGSYKMELAGGAVRFNLMPGGKFVEVVTPKAGHPFTIEGRWWVELRKVKMEGFWEWNKDRAALPFEKQGDIGKTWWRIIDSYDHKGGFALFGPETGPSDEEWSIVEKK